MYLTNYRVAVVPSPAGTTPVQSRRFSPALSGARRGVNTDCGSLFIFYTDETGIIRVSADSHTRILQADSGPTNCTGIRPESVSKSITSKSLDFSPRHYNVCGSIKYLQHSIPNV